MTGFFNIGLGILYANAKVFRGLFYSIVRNKYIFARKFAMRILRLRNSIDQREKLSRRILNIIIL